MKYSTNLQNIKTMETRTIIIVYYFIVILKNKNNIAKVEFRYFAPQYRVFFP